MGNALKSTITGNNIGKDRKILEICDEQGVTDDMRYTLAKVVLEKAQASEEKEKKLRWKEEKH